MGKRVSYFDRQFLRAEDFQAEQGYHLGRRRGLCAGMFRPGVAAGLEVVRVDTASVRVTAGLAIDGLGRDIVLDRDSGAIPVDPAATVEIWIAYAEAGSDAVSYLGADEQRFTRIDEAPAIVPVPPEKPESVPAGGIRLAVVPKDGEPDMSGRPLAGPRNGSVTALSLTDASVTERAIADDAVTSRALAETDGGVSGQDTARGSGVKTDHLQNGAVTADKLSADVTDSLFDRIAERLNQTGLPIADGTIAAEMLADDAVSSRVLAEAAAGSSDQDTNAGSGVKTGHLADAAVTQPKLAAGAVSFDKLTTKLVFNDEVPVTATAAADVVFETVPFGDRAFYLVSVGFTFPVLAAPFPKVRWAQFAEGEQGDVQRNGVRIENLGEQGVRVRCVAFRLG